MKLTSLISQETYDALHALYQISLWTSQSHQRPGHTTYSYPICRFLTPRNFGPAAAHLVQMTDPVPPDAIVDLILTCLPSETPPANCLTPYRCASLARRPGFSRVIALALSSPLILVDEVTAINSVRSPLESSSSPCRPAIRRCGQRIEASDDSGDGDAVR